MSDIHLSFTEKLARKKYIEKNSCWFVKVVSLTYLFNFLGKIWEYDSKIPI